MVKELHLSLLCPRLVPISLLPCKNVNTNWRIKPMWLSVGCDLADLICPV